MRYSIKKHHAINCTAVEIAFGAIRDKRQPISKPAQQPREVLCVNSRSDKAHKQLSAKFRSHPPSAKARAANSACRLVANDKRNTSSLGRQAQLKALGEAVAHYLAQGG